MTGFLKYVAALGLALLLVDRTHATQIALVDQDVGHSLLFEHRGNCFAVLPSHVAEQDVFSLSLPLQNIIGVGTVFARDRALDLALAFVEGDITLRCSDAWDRFQTPLTRMLETQRSGEILRLSPEGVLDRTAATIHTITPEFVVVRTSNELADGAIYKGTSGSALVIGDQVIGIAQRARTGTEAEFLRMDAIAARLGKDLSLKGFQAAAATQSGNRVTGWTGKALTGLDGTPSGGILPRAYVSAWTGKPIQLEITLHPSQAIPLNSVVLHALQTAPDQSGPKSITLESDVGAAGAPYWRSLATVDMPPSGKLELPTGGVYARRIRLIISSMWFADRTYLRIDHLDVK